MAFTPPSDAVETQESKDVTSSTSSFKPPSDAVESKQSDIDWKNIGRTSVETVPAATAGLAGFGAGMVAGAKLSTVVAPLTGPLAPVTAGVLTFGGGLGGAFLASGAAQKVTDLMHEAFAPEDYKARQAQKAANPYGTFAAQTLTNIAGMSPKTIPEVAGKVFTKPLVQRGVSAGLTGSIEAGAEYATEGKIDPIKVLASAAAGAAMPGFNPFGRKAFEAGESAARAVLPKTSARSSSTSQPPPPPPDQPPAGATPEEKTQFLKNLQEAKAQRDSTRPLVETAIRNKETGEIERMGPKHDPARIAETVDTYDQGFVDDAGNFHTRDEAVDQAKRSGQISKDQTLENVPKRTLTDVEVEKAGGFKMPLDQVAKEGDDIMSPWLMADGKIIGTGQDHIGFAGNLIETLPNGYSDFMNQTGAIRSSMSIDAVTGEYVVSLHMAEGQAPTAQQVKTIADIEGIRGKPVTILLGRADGLVNPEYKPITLKELQASASKQESGLKSSDLRKAGDERFNLTGKRPVTLGDTTAPRYLYHGTRADVEQMITPNGDLVLMPSSNFGGKTTSFSMTHNLDVATDYATRVKGGGPDGFTFKNSKIIKIHSDALPEGVSRESGEEWALNTDKPTVIPKGKFEIIEHPLSGKELGENPEYTIREYIDDNYSELEQESLYASGEPAENPVFMEGYLETAWSEQPEKLAKHYELSKKEAEEKTRLKEIVELRATGLYKEPAVEWGKAKDSKEVLVEPTPEVDRTTTNPRDVKDAQEFFEISQEIFEKHGEVEAIKFFEGYQEYKKTWLEPISETEKYVGINIRNKQANERIIHNEKEEILKGIPDANRRVAVAEAIDKGDLSGLSKEEIAIANKYQDLVKDIGDRAVKEGVVKGLLDNYVSHILDWVGAPKGAREQFINEIFGKGASDPSMRGMDVTSKFAKERKLPTFEQLEAWLDTVNERIAASGKTAWRLKLKTKDIAEVYKEYALSMEKAIENKKLVDSLKQVRNVAGESTIKEVNKDNPMPYGWEMMNIPQFSGYAVHPDMMPALKFVFDAGPGDLMKALGFVSQLSKRMNVVGSFFHAKSLMEVMSSAQIPIWTPLKEAFVLPLVEKGVKAFTGKNLQLSAVSKAVEQFKKGGVGTNVDRWIRQDGLVLEMPEDVAQGIITSIGKFADSMIGKYGPKTRVLEKSLSVVEKYTLGLFDKYTWDYLHTGGKIMVADAYLDKARMKAFEEGRPFDETQQRKEIARFVNDSFGGINWFDAATSARQEFARRMADSTRGTGIASKALDKVSEIKSRASMAAFSPAGRRGLQLALFAPDWTISTVRAFTAALPKQLNPTKWQPVEGIKGMMTPTTKADYARLYQFKTALTYFTLINTINLLTANRPVWENKDPTRIEWPDGTSMQAMKHAMEPYHWMMDPAKTLSNKLGFIPKATVVGIAGVEYASSSAQKLVDPSALGRLKAVASMFLPFQASAAIAAPPGEGTKRAILGTMGLPVYGATAEQKKTVRAERELILKENSWKYHEKEIKRGREEPSAKHDQIKRSLERSRKKLEEQKGEQ
jgi:hypothetical protein